MNHSYTGHWNSTMNTLYIVTCIFKLYMWHFLTYKSERSYKGSKAKKKKKKGHHTNICKRPNHLSPTAKAN